MVINDDAGTTRPLDWPAATCCLGYYRCYCGKSADPDRQPRDKSTIRQPSGAEVDRLARVLAMIQWDGNEASATADLPSWRKVADGLLQSAWLDDQIRNPR